MLTLVLLGSIAGLVGVLVAACWWARAPVAIPDRGGQAITVRVSGSYRPSLFVVCAGAPLRISFLREEHDPCSEEVFLPDFQVARHLTVGRTVAVEVLPGNVGEYLFTCRYGRYIGLIRARPALEVAIRRRIRALLPIRRRATATAINR